MVMESPEQRPEAFWGSRYDALLVGEAPGHGFIDHKVAGRVAVVHRRGIDEELEGGAGLALGGHLVVVPGVEVHIAHPGFDVAGVRLHSHEAGVEELHHIAHRVDGAHHGGVAAIVVEELHFVGPVEVVGH